MTSELRAPELRVPAAGRQPALILRPWQAADMPALVAEMGREYPAAGLCSGAAGWSSQAPLPAGAQRWTGPVDDSDAAHWLEGQDRGWQAWDWLSFAVIADDAGELTGPAGHIGLENRSAGGPVGDLETAELHYWTATAARGLGIAPAAVTAVTDWVAGAQRGTALREIMIVHDLDNPASCRVAEKAGYPFHLLSPAQPPLWFTDGHIHLRPLA
jgi:RimJ/RimL family protein N-acetyltransferase